MYNSTTTFPQVYFLPTILFTMANNELSFNNPFIPSSFKYPVADDEKINSVIFNSIVFLVSSSLLASKKACNVF